jgi:hypothetical protein
MKDHAMLLQALFYAAVLIKPEASAAPAAGWSSATESTGLHGDREEVWTINSDDASATLEVRCVTGRVNAATIVLTTKASLLKMADDAGEIEYALCFGDDLQAHTTHIASGFHGLVVSSSKEDVKHLVLYDGRPLLVRVSGRKSDAVYTFSLAGATQVGLGTGCIK